jgi:hypothetical protein
MRRTFGVLTLAALGLSVPLRAQETPTPGIPPTVPSAASPSSSTATPYAPDVAVPGAPEPAVPSVAADPTPVVTVDPTPAAASVDHPVILDPRAPAKTEVNLDRSTQLAAGIGFSGPIGAGASLRLLHGLGADVKDDGTRVKAVCAVPMPHCAQGFLLQADAGSGGGKLSLGIGVRAHVEDEGFRGTAGVALRLAVARTWGNPVGTDPGLTYVGPELDLSVIRIGLTLGVLFRVSGDHGSNALFSWGLGFGL